MYIAARIAGTTVSAVSTRPTAIIAEWMIGLGTLRLRHIGRPDTAAPHGIPAGLSSARHTPRLFAPPAFRHKPTVAPKAVAGCDHLFCGHLSPPPLGCPDTPGIVAHADTTLDGLDRRVRRVLCAHHTHTVHTPIPPCQELFSPCRSCSLSLSPPDPHANLGDSRAKLFSPMLACLSTRYLVNPAPTLRIRAQNDSVQYPRGFPRPLTHAYPAALPCQAVAQSRRGVPDILPLSREEYLALRRSAGPTAARARQHTLRSQAWKLAWLRHCVAGTHRVMRERGFRQWSDAPWLSEEDRAVIRADYGWYRRERDSKGRFIRTGAA